MYKTKHFAIVHYLNITMHAFTRSCKETLFINIILIKWFIHSQKGANFKLM